MVASTTTISTTPVAYHSKLSVGAIIPFCRHTSKVGQRFRQRSIVKRFETVDFEPQKCPDTFKVAFPSANPEEADWLPKKSANTLGYLTVRVASTYLLIFGL